MAPPKWLVEYWKQEPNWIKRFQRGTELNAFLCGTPLYRRSDTLWTPAAIKQFKTYMNRVKQLAPEGLTLYRGTSMPSPTYHPLCAEMSNCQFLSTSKSKSIAAEFGRKGFLHIFKLEKGVAIYDMKDIYGTDPVKREKEVLLYPGATMSLVSLKGNTFTWKVSV
jgi:hypothetical protein